MSINTEAFDWEACGVAQAGGVCGLGAGIFLYEFRSRIANFRGTYLLTGLAIGLGGSLGGGVAPSPWNVATNTQPNLWSSINCTRPFSGDDLDTCYGSVETVGAAGALGYFLTRISGGYGIRLFDRQNVSGWGTGVGVIGAILPGMWTRIGQPNTFW
jgi:hypothetical protein